MANAGAEEHNQVRGAKPRSSRVTPRASCRSISAIRALTDERRLFLCGLMQVLLGMRDERVALRFVAEVVMLARVLGGGRVALHIKLHAAEGALGARADIRRGWRSKHPGYRGCIRGPRPR